MSGRTRALGAVLAGIVLGSAATIGVALWQQSPAPSDRPSAEQSSAPVSVPVTREVLVDSEVVSGALSWADTALTFAADGVVTAMPVADQSEIRPGQIVAEINDQPVVALHMEFGPWRELGTGSTGADVRQLHAALAELGLYDGEVAEPIGAHTFAALAAVDARLGADPIPVTALVAVDATGSTLQAPGVGVGTQLGELSMAVRRHSDRIAVDDGGMAAQYARQGQGLDLFGADGAPVWKGTIAAVATEASRTLLTVTGEDPLPEELGTASIIVTRTDNEVLAVPRVAITPRPDGTSTVTVAGSASQDDRTIPVDVGLCTVDLCEIVPGERDEHVLEPGTPVLVP